MNLSSRTGWLRLGIVISVFWLCCVSLYAMYVWHAETKDLSSAALMSKSAGGWAVVGQESFLMSCNLVGEKASCVPRIFNISVIGFLPLLVMWLIGLSFAWVRRGFRAKET